MMRCYIYIHLWYNVRVDKTVKVYLHVWEIVALDLHRRCHQNWWAGHEWPCCIPPTLPHRLCRCQTQGSAPLHRPERIFCRRVESIVWSPLWIKHSRLSVSIFLFCLSRLSLQMRDINLPALNILSAFVSIFFTISVIFLLCSAGLSFFISSVSWKNTKQDVCRWQMSGTLRWRVSENG